jgi:bifunctional non-homologous end joining protein LigD
VIFDLDPSGDDVDPIRHTAGALRDLLRGLELAPRVKSSGSRGLHVVVDVIDDDVDFELTKRFSQAVAQRISEDHADVTTEQRKERRGGRLFLDVLRNAPANHAVAPYSVRALPGAPVAAPLDWDEALRSDFDPRRITVENLFRRLGQRDDPWADPPRPSSTIATALASLEQS